MKYIKTFENFNNTQNHNFEDFNDRWIDNIINMKINNLNDAIEQRFFIWKDIEIGNFKSKLLHKYYSDNFNLIEKIINETSDIDMINKSLDFACDKNFIQGMNEIIKMLIDNGGNINNQSSQFGQTPLMYAAEKGNVKLVEYLINEKCNVNIKNSYNQTALHYSTDCVYDKIDDCLKITKLLINSNIDLNVQSNYWEGGTALIRSIKGKKKYSSSYINYNKITQYLIDSGANLNMQNLYGQTALIKCSIEKNKIILKSLIKSGADWAITDNKNKDFIDYLKPELKNKIITMFPKEAEQWILQKSSKKYNL